MEANGTHFEECNISHKNCHNFLHGHCSITKTIDITQGSTGITFFNRYRDSREPGSQILFSTGTGTYRDRDETGTGIVTGTGMKPGPGLKPVPGFGLDNF